MACGRPQETFRLLLRLLYVPFSFSAPPPRRMKKPSSKDKQAKQHFSYCNAMHTRDKAIGPNSWRNFLVNEPIVLTSAFDGSHLCWNSPCPFFIFVYRSILYAIVHGIDTLEFYNFFAGSWCPYMTCRIICFYLSLCLCQSPPVSTCLFGPVSFLETLMPFESRWLRWILRVCWLALGVMLFVQLPLCCTISVLTK